MEKLITDEVRLNFPELFVPKSFEGGPEKYSVTILIPKTNTTLIEKINQAVEEALEAGKVSKFGGKIPPRGSLTLPLHDGDTEKEGNEYQGHYFLTARSKWKPEVVDASLQPIMSESEIYSGCYGRVSLTFYAFNKLSKGVAVGLGNVMKTRDGERIGGSSTSAADDFAEFGEQAVW